MTSKRQPTRLEKQEPTFYARIPKMCSMDLDPYELALYCNYKQTAAEKGTSWKSNKTLAKETKMSVSKVQRARKSLAEKGLVNLEYISDENGVVNQSVNVTIVDVWQENHNRYAQDTPPMYVVPTPHVQDTPGGVPDTTKEELSSKNHKEEDISTSVDEIKEPDIKSATPIQDETQDSDKPSLEVNKQARGIIAVFLKTTKTINKNAYKFWMDEAQELAGHGITPAHVAEWIKHTTSQDWWSSGMPSWRLMCQKILAWRDDKKAVPFDNRLQARKLPANIDMLDTGEVAS